MLGLIGRKVLELVALPLAELVVPPLAGAAARLWESKSRIAGPQLHPGQLHQRRRAQPGRRRLGEVGDRPLAVVRARHLRQHRQRVSRLPVDLLAALSDHYGGRVAAIDHHTLGVDPIGNADLVHELVPDGVQPIEADIVCHSRGGLVSRALAGQGGDPVFGVRRIVHVASANHGTALATPNNLVPFIDRITTTMVNLIPDGPAAVVETALTSVLVVVKMSPKYGLVGIRAWPRWIPPVTSCTASTAPNCRPSSSPSPPTSSPSGGWRAMAVKSVQNVVVDRVFGDLANDLVVPTTVFTRATTPCRCVRIAGWCCPRPVVSTTAASSASATWPPRSRVG